MFQRTGKIAGNAPAIDLSAERSLQAVCIELASASLICSAHDCAEGGLAVALAEAVIESRNGLGATITHLPIETIRPDFALFGESQSRVVASCKATQLQEFMTVAAKHGVPVHQIGKVMAQARLTIANKIDLEVGVLREIYRSAIPGAVGETN